MDRKEQDKKIRKKHKMHRRTRIYWWKNCPCWAVLVVELAGGVPDNARKKLMKWENGTIDTDELLHPVEKSRNSRVRQRKVENAKVQRRLDSIPSPTAYEMEHLL